MGYAFAMMVGVGLSVLVLVFVHSRAEPEQRIAQQTHGAVVPGR